MATLFLRAFSPGSSWQPGLDTHGPLETQGFEVVEPAQPIHANLIEFRASSAATRKVRPRHTERCTSAGPTEQMQVERLRSRSGEHLHSSPQRPVCRLQRKRRARPVARVVGHSDGTRGQRVEMASSTVSPPVDRVGFGAAGDVRRGLGDSTGAHRSARDGRARSFSLITSVFLGTALTVLSKARRHARDEDART